MTKPNILIVDDDRDIVNVLTIILEENDFYVHSVFKGKDAVEVIKKKRPDLILLDYMLPDINGDEVSRHIRGILKDSPVPIVLISAAHNAQRIADQAEMDGYIPKPFEMDELLSTIKRLLTA
jgi:DNA-binding response OmpR family regulator